MMKELLKWIFSYPRIYIQASILFCYLAVYVQCDAQSLPSAQFNIQQLEYEGFSPGTSVLSVLQDKQRFMWFGSGEGLFRYDGYKFEKIELNPIQESTDYTSIGSYFIMEGSDDAIWSSTHQTLFRHDLTNKQNIWPILSFGEISKLLEIDPDFYWISSSYGRIYSLIFPFSDSRDSFQIVEYQPNYLESLNALIDSDSTEEFVALIAIKDNDHLIQKFEILETTSFLIMSIVQIDSFQSDSSWLTSENGNNVWSLFSSKTHYAGGSPINRLHLDHLRLNPGLYELHYQSSKMPFRSWQQGQNSMPEFLGVTLSKANNAIEKEINRWNDLARAEEFPSSYENSCHFQKDNTGSAWIASEKSLFKIVERDQFFDFNLVKRPAEKTQVKYDLLNLEAGPNGQFWILGIVTLQDMTTHLILDLFDPKKEVFTKVNEFEHDFRQSGPILPRTVFVFDSIHNAIWIGFQGSQTKGLLLLRDPYNGILEQVSDRRGNLFTRNIYDLEMDHSGILWICTSGLVDGAGIFKLDTKSENIQYFHFEIEGAINVNPKVRATSFVEDINGNVWIGTQGHGIFGFDIHTNKIHHVQPTYLSENGTILQQNDCQLFRDLDSNIWVSGPNAIHLFTPPSENFNTFYIKTDSLLLSPKAKFRIYDQNSEGMLWGSIRSLKFSNVLLQFNPKEKKFILDLAIPDIYRFADVMENAQRELLVATGSLDGFFKINLDSVMLRNYSKTNLLQNLVWDTYKDEQDIIWAGTWHQGLAKIDPSKKAVKKIQVGDGLISNSIFSILPDNKNNLWLLTDKGFNIYNPFEDFLSTPFSITEIEGGNNYFGKNYVHSNGTFFVSTKSSGGFYSFHPDSIKKDKIPPKISITGFQISGAPLKIGVGSILQKSPGYTETLKLKHNQNTLAIEYVGLHYARPEANTYMYKMGGLDDEWIQVGTERVARYPGLLPGDYTFQVKAANVDGIWSTTEASVIISISPPWWKTTFAYLIYGACMIGLLVALYRFQLKRKLDYADHLRLAELDEVKTKLYTNITHEFRTPLTVISGMADQTIERKGILLKDEALVNAKAIKRNSKQLLSLVNQMLDLRKLESGSMPLNMINGDLLIYAKYVLESFHSYAESMHVQLHFTSKWEKLQMDYDQEKTLSVLSNLISNAIKFSSEGGHVYLSIDKNETDKICIKIKDSGIGIPPSKQKQIFDRFYQANNEATRQTAGTGIGLALTKELVKLMKGEISLESELGKGSEFVVILPFTNKVSKVASETDKLKVKSARPIEFPTSITTSVLDNHKNKVSSHPIVLIIEDSPDVIRYISICLVSDYQIKMAFNGREGLETAFEIIPDIIISDVMMPEKDGFEVTRILKSDERTSHIPIILLTAKADIESKLVGLEHGADAYLHKPFHKEELLIRINKLLKLRQTLRNYYLSLGSESKDNISEQTIGFVKKTEDLFVKKVRSIIVNHLDDFDFTVADLCREVTMSHSSLHRKLIALTGYSSNRFIRFIRLSKAKHLLRDSEITIGNVAYKTGFNDPVYFARVFRKEFGMTPSAFRKKN